jgi:hypothetical protein
MRFYSNKQTNRTKMNLFDLPETLSPRLEWIRKNGILITDGGKDFQDGDESEFSSNQLYRFYAGIGETVCGGHTEDQAIVGLAKLMKLKLWNEP